MLRFLATATTSVRTGARRLGQGTRSAARRVWKPVPHTFFWAPVWIPLLLWAQFALLGLRPALTEGLRLQREAARLGPAHASALAENEDLQAALIAWDDPVYRERWRRHARSALR